MKRPATVEVLWDDACSYTSWHSRKAAKRWAKGRYRCRSVGLLVSESKTGLTLALSENCFGGYGDLLRIPRGMVLKVRVLAKGGR
jgi:hypothetical protein